MAYLIVQIILCLIAAFVLGLFIGWLLWGRRTREPFDVERDLERIERSRLERELETARQRIRQIDERAATAGAATVGTAAALVSSREDAADDAPEASGDTPAPEVYTATPPVSDLSPVEPGRESGPEDPFATEPFGEAGGPTEATFTDDIPEVPAPPPSERRGAPAYDDLQRISGIGPAIESQLAEIGVTTYRQIALFSDADIERVGAHIDFFPDRIRREGWVVQAAALHRQTYGTAP